MGQIILQSVILICIVVLGYVLKKTKLFSGFDYRVLTKIIMYITLPCVIMVSFSSFEWDPALFFIPFLGISVNVVLQILAYFMCRRSDDQDKKFFMLNTPGFSIGTFAMPFIQNMLGTEGVVAACMFDAGGTLMPSGISCICTSAILDEKKEKLSLSFVVKKLLSSPPFMTYLVMFFLKITHIELPDILQQFADKVGDANTFICMFMVGLMFEVKFPKGNMLKAAKLIRCV